MDNLHNYILIFLGVFGIVYFSITLDPPISFIATFLCGIVAGWNFGQLI